MAQGGLQLLPDTHRRVEVRMPGENRTFYTGIIALLVSGGIFLGLNSYVNSLNKQMTTLDDQLIRLEAGRNKEAEAKLVTFNQQTSLMSGLLSNHLFWTQALAKVASLISTQVQVITLDASASKKDVSIKALAPGYDVIARQIAAFSKDASISDVEMGPVTARTDGRLEFSLILKFNDQKLLKKTK